MTVVPPRAAPPPSAPASGLAALARMVKLSHSLFALPFVAAAVALVARDAVLDPLRLALVAVAVVAARTAAMAMNRIADRAFDARNPRTSGASSSPARSPPRAAWALLAGSAAAFVLAAALISPLCGWLAAAGAGRSCSATPTRSGSPGPATSGSASRRRSRPSASPSR